MNLVFLTTHHYNLDFKFNHVLLKNCYRARFFSLWTHLGIRFETFKYARVPPNILEIARASSKFLTPWKGKVNRWRIIGEPVEKGNWRCRKKCLFPNPGEKATVKSGTTFTGFFGSGAIFSRYHPKHWLLFYDEVLINCGSFSSHYQIQKEVRMLQKRKTLRYGYKAVKV